MRVNQSIKQLNRHAKNAVCILLLAPVAIALILARVQPIEDEDQMRVSVSDVSV